MNWIKGDYLVSDEIDRLKTAEVERLMKQCHWCEGYSSEVIDRLLAKSFWLGLFFQTRLIGIIRAVTDEETVAVITDVIVDEDHRRKGLGTWFMQCLVDHPRLCRTSMSLGTQDADFFYQKFGFERASVMVRCVQPPARTAPSRQERKIGFSPKGGLRDR